MNFFIFSFAFISKMSYKPVVKKRRSDTPKAKNQQRCRHRTGLFKKAYEYGVECDADVCVVLRIRQNGQIFTFNSDSSGHWPPPQQLVCLTFTISWSWVSAYITRTYSILSRWKKQWRTFPTKTPRKTPSIPKDLKCGSRIEDWWTVKCYDPKIYSHAHQRTSFAGTFD